MANRNEKVRGDVNGCVRRPVHVANNLLRALCIVAAFLVALPASAAEDSSAVAAGATAAPETVPVSVTAPVDIPAVPPLPFWQQRNRFIRVSATQLDRQYTEFDTQGVTIDGILDTETGAIPGVAGLGRWQGELSARNRASLLLEIDYRLFVGATHYRGYLIPLAGGALIPYSGDTDNIIHDMRARAAVTFVETPHWQCAPFLELRSQGWFRDLGQYSETYQHIGAGIGVLLQWRVADAWVVEWDAGAGTTVYAVIDAPFAGFPQALGNKPLTSFGASLRWQISERAGLALGFRRDRSSYGESAVVGGIFEPPSDTDQTAMQAGVEYRY